MDDEDLGQKLGMRCHCGAWLSVKNDEWACKTCKEPEDRCECDPKV